MKRYILFFMILLTSQSVFAVTVLNIEAVRKLAVENNRMYLKSIEEINKAQSEITTAKSSALPELNFDAYYNRNIKLPTFFFDVGGETVEFTSGFKNDFGASLSLRQSIWKGGKVFKAYRIAKLYKSYSDAVSEQVKAEVINAAEQLYFAAMLSESNLEVLQKEKEATAENLMMIEKKFSKGMVSEYEVLRARVEDSNLKPMILKAESEKRLSLKRLKSFLGLNLSEEIIVEGYNDDYSLKNLKALHQFIDTALVARPEMVQSTLMADITKNAVGVMKADYYPTVEAVSNYSWTTQSDRMTLSENQVNTWSAGVQVHFPIFSGGSTKGEVSRMKAEYKQAVLQKNEVADKVRLEIEEAFDKLLQSKETLDIQATTIAQAEEGLKIANLRYESGIGTQLEVISAQSALTRARNALALAQFEFRIAKSNMKKVTTIDLN